MFTLFFAMATPLTVRDNQYVAYSAQYPESLFRNVLLVLRLGTLTIIVALLTMHLRSVRVFRWEQSVSGGLLTTYFLAVAGLVLCAGTTASLRRGAVLQCYLNGTGAALLAINAGALWHRWRKAGNLTRAVADLLSALGIPLRRQVLIKVTLSSIAACCMLIDLTLVITAMYVDLSE